MGRLAFTVAIALFLIAPTNDVFAHPPIPLTQCGNITQPGNYFLANDLELAVYNPTFFGGGGDCLVISSPHVNIDMQGHSIAAVCPTFPMCISAFGPVGDIGLHILSGADHVAISNGGVVDFVDGIEVEANHVSIANAEITDGVFGMSLENVSYSSFTDIYFTLGPIPYNYFLLSMLSVSGGGHNTFTRLSNLSNTQGIAIGSSSYNVIDSANISCVSLGPAGPGILLTQDSDHNSVTNSSVNVLFGTGIEVDAGSDNNIIQGNDVFSISPLNYFALLDQNPDCGSDLWTGNSFTNETDPALVSASPESCIH